MKKEEVSEILEKIRNHFNEISVTISRLVSFLVDSISHLAHIFVYICVSKPYRQNGRKVTRKYVRIAEKIKI